MTGEATQYTQGGLPLENRDILGRYNCTQFGYGGGLPILTAQNAPKTDVWFESFEWMNSVTATHYLFPNNYDVAKQDVIWEQINGHSGTHCMGVLPSVGIELPKGIGSVNKPMRISVWVKYEKPTSDPIADAAKIKFGVSSDILKHVARVGEWNLMEATLSPASMNASWFLKNMSNGKMWFDDLRIQPLDAATTAYVYDPATFRLITQFDDSHFGVYFQYDAQGKLVRKMLETERGMKIVQESHTLLMNNQN